MLTAVTADRGYGQSLVDDQLHELGVDLIAIPRKGKTSQKRRTIETADDFVELVKWRTGSEGRIATLKRQHGWDRARIRGLDGVVGPPVPEPVGPWNGGRRIVGGEAERSAVTEVGWDGKAL